MNQTRLNHLDEATCKECQGRCCKRLPGAAAPEDFGETKEERIENVLKALQSGDWQLDHWEGDATLPKSRREVDGPHWIRPKVLDGRTGVFSATWGGPCVFLTDTGCKLAAGARPFECRMTKPGKLGSYDCHGDYENKLTCAELWIDAGIDLEALGRDVIREQDGPWGEEFNEEERERRA